jgi:hypothetical protein
LRHSLLAGGGFLANGHRLLGSQVIGDGRLLLVEHVVHFGRAPACVDTALRVGSFRRNDLSGLHQDWVVMGVETGTLDDFLAPLCKRDGRIKLSLHGWVTA